MHCEKKGFPYEYSVEETEEGYAIYMKGDKEKLKAQLEAMEAYHNFREKFKAAGFGYGHQGSKHCKEGFFSMIHKHIQAVHRKGTSCHKKS